jgi:uncharacterized protein (DUF2141 family)
MNPLLFLAGAALLVPGAALAHQNVDGTCGAQTGPHIRVQVAGLKDRSGRVKLELYPANEADFLKDDRDLVKEGKVFRRAWAPMPKSGLVTLCIQAPRAGRWAVLFTHDRDGKNKFNFWQDGAGFVSAERMGRSRPKLAQAAISVPAAGTTISVRVQYLRGLSGFSPLNAN